MSEDEKEAIKTVEYLKTMKWYSHAFDNGTEILTEDQIDELTHKIIPIEKNDWDMFLDLMFSVKQNRGD